MRHWTTFGKSVGEVGYDALFDYDADGKIATFDFGQFRSRFGKAKTAFA